MANSDPSLDATELGLEPSSDTVASAPALEVRHGKTIGVGDVLGGYELLRRLGVGGMGEVFAARCVRETEADPIALKILGRASPTHLYRFKREFRALADVAHPNLIELHELVVPDDAPAFFTMELIDGEPFDAYVRGGVSAGELPNLARLERALRQLVSGVQKLHALGCVHRDLKPSNVLVDRSGRVVILDFGLVSELDNLDESVTHDGQLLGTPAYMAPEQAMSGKAGPAADYYAIGVMLYECLTGSKPFVGSAMRVMMAKQDGEVPDPGAVVARVPQPLRELCVKLLVREAQLRPTGRELLALLGDDDSHGSSSGASSEVRRVPFVGREAELESLRAALRDVQETRAPVTVLVHGRDGYGKSALLHHFLAHHGRGRDRDRALILSGRCRARESVLYKGIDAAIDALSVHLRRLPAADRAALRPRHAVILAKIFPVLADVWSELGEFDASIDPTERRRLGLLAMRELCLRLADRAPLIVCVDDFQWADLDSLRLLASLLRPPHAPPLLLILGYSDGADGHAESRALTELRDPAVLEGLSVRDLGLGPLADVDARALARRLLGDAADDARVESIARRGEGNPSFIAALALGEPASSDRALDLEELHARRVAALSPRQQRVLAIVALAGGSLTRSVALRALALSVDDREGARLLDELVELDLVVRAAAEAEDARDDPRVELAHERVRASAIAVLAEAERVELHQQLAAALAQLGASAERLAEHFAAAGDHARASEYGERAAREAAEALAFDHAVALYRRTLGWLPEVDSERRQRLQLALAEQLANLGHGSEAADLLLELAGQVDEAQARALRRRAVIELAHTGRVEEAVTLLRALLRELGESTPRGHWSAVSMFVRERVRLAIRGERFEPRAEAEIPEDLRERLDTLMAGAVGLALHEVMLTQALGVRALRLAFDAGDPRRLGVLAGYRASALSAVGQVDRALHFAVEAREIAALTDDPEVHQGNDLIDAMIEWFDNRPRKSKELFGRLLARAEDEAISDWVRSTATIRYAELCISVGDLAEHRARHGAWVASARSRGNLQELASLLATAADNELLHGRVERAREYVEQAHATWQCSRYTFTQVMIDAADNATLRGLGRLDEARAHVASFRESLRASGIWHFRLIRELHAVTRSRVLLCQVLRAPAKPALYHEAMHAAHACQRASHPLYRAHALIDLAALRALRAEDEAARKAWRRALQLCERGDLRAHAAALRLRLARVTRGIESRELETLGQAYLGEQGIDATEAFVDYLVPARGEN